MGLQDKQSKNTGCLVWIDIDWRQWQVNDTTWVENDA